MSEPTSVDVDSGLIWIGDPCYFVSDELWHEFCEFLDKKDFYHQRLMEIDHGETPLIGQGVLVGGFGGDGSYEVKAIRDDIGMVKQIVIQFGYDDTDDEEEENDDVDENV